MKKPDDDLIEKKFQEIEASTKSEASTPPERANNRAATDVASEVAEAVIATGVTLFRDQYNDAYIAVDGNGTNVIKIPSKNVKLWLARFIHMRCKKSVSTETMNRILQDLAGRALFDGEQYPLEVRSVRDADGLWYDLGGSAVHITDNHWEVTDKPPIVFKRFRHQKPQVLPQHGGDLRQLLKYINLPDEREQLLFLVYVVAAFIPGFPHPLLILHGAQGAGKTTPMKLIKELADPSVLGGLSTPKNEEAFIQTASHHSFLFFDNLSRMPEWFSDALARASTGDSFSKRELYSDDEDVLYYIQKTIALNGISQVVHKPDLLDRAILVSLKRITPEKRKEAQVFWAEFEQDRPKILGAIFDVLASALPLYPTVELPSRPRMADFMRWGCIIAEAAGFSRTSFFDAYNDNISLQHDEAIESNPVAMAIMELMQTHEEYADTPANVYGALRTIATKLEINQGKAWPKDASWFGRSLISIAPNLDAKGIHIEHTRGKERLITIRKFAVAAVDTDASDSIPTEIIRQHDGIDGKNPRLNNET